MSKEELKKLEEDYKRGRKLENWEVRRLDYLQFPQTKEFALSNFVSFKEWAVHEKMKEEGFYLL